MPYGTFFEDDEAALTAFSFVVYIADDVWAATTHGTLPLVIPAAVVEEPLGGAAKVLYGVLKVGTADLGPVTLREPGSEPRDPTQVVRVRKGDVVTIQVLGRLPDAL